MTRCLVISPQPFYSPRGTPLSVYYRALMAAESGVRIDLLTYGEGSDVDIPGVRIIRIPRFRLLGNVKTGPSPLKLFLDAFVFLWTVGLLLRRRYQFVHAHEEAVFFCRFLKPIFRFRLVYDMHSSLPQQLTNFGFTRSRLLIGFFHHLENSCLANADAVITICPALADYATSIMPDPQKHVLIENSIFDEVRVQSSGTADDDGSVLERLPHVPLIVYSGSLEKYQSVDLLVQAFARVRRQQPDVALVIAGGDDRQVRELRALADEFGLGTSCLLLGRVSQRTVSRLLEAAAVLVSPRTAGTNTPLKIYQYLACGVPLVATSTPTHTQVLTSDVCWLVDPSAVGLGEGILAALTEPALAAARVRAARSHYQQHYSVDAYRIKLRRVLELLGCSGLLPVVHDTPASVPEASAEPVVVHAEDRPLTRSGLAGGSEA